MRLQAKCKYRIEFYLKNYESILSEREDKKIDVLLPFKSRTISRKKKRGSLTVTAEDLEWAAVVRDTLEGLRDENKRKLARLVFKEGWDITETCECVGIVRSTYFDWIGNIMFKVMIFALSRNLIPESQIDECIIDG